MQYYLESFDYPGEWYGISFTSTDDYIDIVNIYNYYSDNYPFKSFRIVKIDWEYSTTYITGDVR